jgi:hypothetical protein
MKALAQFMIVAAGYMPLAALAACEPPNAISIPDGATATFDVMLAAQSDVKTYMAAMESYLACINEELEVVGDDTPTEFKSALADMHSSGVGELETLAVAFSRELQSFLRAHPELQKGPQTRTR